MIRTPKQTIADTSSFWDIQNLVTSHAHTKLLVQKHLCFIVYTHIHILHSFFLCWFTGRERQMQIHVCTQILYIDIHIYWEIYIQPVLNLCKYTYISYMYKSFNPSILNYFVYLFVNLSIYLSIYLSNLFILYACFLF